MPGFGWFINAAVTVGGTELAQEVRQGQFDTPAALVRKAPA